MGESWLPFIRKAVFKGVACWSYYNKILSILVFDISYAESKSE